MPDRAFEYDLAISFLWDDRSIAVALKSELEGVMHVFVSLDEQHRLGGQDGVNEFTSVFRSEIRQVVVLYRPTYGAQSWTRVEENAIKSRIVEEGLNFLTIVLLEEPGPVWYPIQHQWMPYTGKAREMTDIVGALKYKARQLGSPPRVISLEEKAQREASAREREARRVRRLYSDEGNRLAHDEREKLFNYIKAKAATISTQSPSIPVEVESNWQQLVMWHYRNSIELFWEGPGNNFSGNQFWLREYDGLKPLDHSRRSMRHSPAQRAESSIMFDIRNDEPCWNLSKKASDATAIKTAEELADTLLERLWKMVPRPQPRSRPDPYY